MAQTIPLRENILADIKSDLAEITIEAGYRTTPKRISRILKRPDELSHSDFPSLSIVDGGSAINEETNKELEDMMTVIIYGAVKFSDHDEDSKIASTQLNDLIGDVIEKLYSDTDRGGNAIMTHVTRIVTDKGALEPIAEVEIWVDINFDYSAVDVGRLLR